jgi:hypothetical protein
MASLRGSTAEVDHLYRDRGLGRVDSRPAGDGGETVYDVHRDHLDAPRLLTDLFLPRKGG